MFDKIEDILKGKNTPLSNPTEEINTNDRKDFFTVVESKLKKNTTARATTKIKEHPWHVSLFLESVWNPF